MLPAVYAKDLQFLPMGSELPDETGCRFAVGQQQMLPDGVKPVHDDILVAKMRPGQVIQLEAHCIKGNYLSVQGNCIMARASIRIAYTHYPTSVHICSLVWWFVACFAVERKRSHSETYLPQGSGCLCKWCAPAQWWH